MVTTRMTQFRIEKYDDHDNVDGDYYYALKAKRKYFGWTTVADCIARSDIEAKKKLLDKSHLKAPKIIEEWQEEYYE